ncbi:hypothetical protein Tsubulata_037361 [Turnera subulata]|uniref:Late embryogenesis abundant protein LEA-2 subgroup domain-containing protein n=1 Tax=Turnera subulata TaxID=218843 RepID=A0A9Q0F740_9ROSI|nr:hypothetical protein Tsubulata_037361 [Turnera subulata]
MAEKEQVKPLTSPGFRFHGHDEEDQAISMEFKLRRRNCLKCCGCFAAIFVILVVIALVLGFTIFHVKNPKISTNNIAVQHLELANGTLQPDTNVTVLADVSVKNPNAASFKFKNGTTIIYYGGLMVGQAAIPPGKARAWKTAHFNVTVELLSSRILAVPSLKSDLSSGALTMSTYTEIGGKVRVLKIVEKDVAVRVNCTVTYNISTQDVQEQNCTPDVTL